MPEIKIPRIVRPIDLAKYAPELAAQIADQKPPIFMWVNLPRRMDEEWMRVSVRSRAVMLRTDKAIAEAAPREEIEALNREAAVQLHALASWWSEAWSQGDPDTHWSPEVVEQQLRECSDQDPALWEFIANECWNLVAQHRERARKN